MPGSLGAHVPPAFGRDKATISGPSTGLATALGVSVDGASNIYVLNQSTSAGATTNTVLVFSPTASGNASPASQITSSSWTVAVGQIGLL